MKNLVWVMPILLVGSMQAIPVGHVAMDGVGTAEYLEVVSALLPGESCYESRSSSSSRLSSIKTQDTSGCLDTFTSCFTSVFSCFKRRAGQAGSQSSNKRITQ